MGGHFLLLQVPEHQYEIPVIGRFVLGQLVDFLYGFNEGKTIVFGSVAGVSTVFQRRLVDILAALADASVQGNPVVVEFNFFGEWKCFLQKFL